MTTRMPTLLLFFTLWLMPQSSVSSRQDTQPPNKRGVHLLLDDGRNQWLVEQWASHMAYARHAAGEWGYVTQVVRGDDLDPVRWQAFMDLCAVYRLTPILRLATTFDHESGYWNAPTPDPDNRYVTVAGQYADFVAALQWPTDAHRVIVANEPNHGNEWGGVPNPAAYARFLIDVAAALHAADPAAMVMNAGFDHYSPHTGGIPFVNGMAYMDAESFMDGMVTAYPDVFTHIDAWSSHPYPLGAFSQPPWEQQFHIDYLNGASNPGHLTPPAGIYNRGVNAYEWELLKLASYGVEGLPVYITETGWRHAESTDPAALDNGRAWPDATTVGIYVDLVMYGNNGRYPNLPEDGWRPWQDDPRVVGVTFFALNGVPLEWGHTNWLQIDADGTVLGTYPAADVLAHGGQ